MKNPKNILILVSLCIISGNQAQAITPEQYQQQRDEVIQQTQIPSPDVTIDTDAFKVPTEVTTIEDELVSGNELCFDIRHLYLTGELAEQFNFAIHPFIHGSDSILGSCMDVATINTLVSKVQNMIVDRGYITTRVLVQNQNLSTGDLYLSLVPGRIGQIKADNLQADRSIYTNVSGNPANFAPAMPMKAGVVVKYF